MSLVTFVGSRLDRARTEILWSATPRKRWLERAAHHQWVFVTGCNRSGKTMISNLIKHHPEVSVVPNANKNTRALPDTEREGCRHIWVEQLERFRLTEADSLAPSSRLAFDWLNYHRDTKRVLVLESGLSSIQMRWLQEIFPSATMIGMIRNGYAVAEGLRLKEGYSIERCASQWAISTATMLQDAPRLRRFRVVRYEDFVERPHAVIVDLCDYLGLDSAPLLPVIDRGWRLGNVDTNPSSLANGNPDLITHLTPNDCARIEQVAAPLLKQLGYLRHDKLTDA